MLKFIKAPLLSNNSRLSHGFSLRYKCDYTNVSPKIYAIQQLSSILKSEQNTIFSLNQVHSNKIVIINKKEEQSFQIPEADASITTVKNICLVIFTADCLPIIVYDNKTNIIAIIHAGWRGTSLGITQRVIMELIEKFNCKPQNLIVGLGPCIDSCCYEVGCSLLDIFENRYKNVEQFFIKCAGKYKFSLKKANEYQVLASGIPKKNIDNIHLCTHCNPLLFFSYRRNHNETNRMINYIMLKE